MGFGRHTHFVTVGQLLGAAGCRVPTCGLRLDHDAAARSPGPLAGAAAPASDAFTTVGHWRSYGSIEHEGVSYGQRAHSLRQLIELPRASAARFRAGPRHPSGRGGRPARPCAATAGSSSTQTRWPGTPRPLRRLHPPLFRRAGSRQERLRQLAQRLVQRSQRLLPRRAAARSSPRRRASARCCRVGEGLLSFATVAEAAAAVEAIRARSGAHRARARELAEDLFDARKVLSKLLAELASGPPAPSRRPDDRHRLQRW